MEVNVDLPTFHPGQLAAYRKLSEHRFQVLRAGRRFGKTDYGKVIACDAAIKRFPVGIFAPDYKILAETYNDIAATLDPVIKSASKVEGVIRTITGGRLDFWTLENERAGRSRKYKLAWIDEGAFTKPNMMGIWEKSIRPTLLDLKGSALVTSNTNGIDEDNFLYQICPKEGEEVSKYGFAEYHAPTHQNPYLPADELEKLQTDNHPLVYQQEYLAEFVDWSGVAFFELDKLLENGKPVEFPAHCDTVFAIIDTAVKTGSANDGTGVIYFARSKFVGHPLTILDYDYVQLEGASLEYWMPSIFMRLEELAKACKARMGSIGAFIEDAQSGSILLQQARRNNWPAQGIESELTSKGKDERAINASPFVHRGMVKVSREAYDKVLTFKGVTRNHMMAQILGFRVGDKDAARRADDLLDDFTYGIALSLGGGDGI
jgi:hypothetical protein